ncbi:uncharacterized protein EAE97_011180 [Botrytis byssoidea]|uniref:DUF6594 domain-containing protein n=1 Tax=Botrytis byssoidea TaxID=139641 RepID=A0A9P5HWY4_9HELO|nr:uncharacterized protein EAE97_011180 [Botrytis byssoidea]KAF7921889.1 hypothetical protein EAE97_011180 [Botrytis byssoidea]
MPIDKNVQDSMEKGAAANHVTHLYPPASFDPVTLQPVKPNGMTQEDFESTLPDDKTERYLVYIRGLKDRKSPTEFTSHVIDLRPDGYPRLAEAVACKEEFMMYRRFGHLQARLLLDKQDELRALESQLAHMDQWFEKNFPERNYSRERIHIESGEYKELLGTIEKRMKEYAQLLTFAQTFANFDRPMASDRLQIKNYLDYKVKLCARDQDYITKTDDLITLKPSRENTWLDTKIEQIPQLLPCKLTRELQQKTDSKDSNIILSSPERVNVVVTLIILAAVLILLIVPVFLLWFISNLKTSRPLIGVLIALLLVFTLIFSGVLSAFTRAKRHEIIAAAAAYCAVLVVFVGNVGSLPPPAGG